jgi:hypothetical protein
MKKLTLIFVLSTYVVFAQDWGIKFGGFLKTDLIYNTRKTIDIRDGELYFYPDNEKLDKDGNDLNAVPNFNILSFQSRLAGNITAPDFLDAKVSGLLETEFFGTSNADINGLRLRHALINVDWGGFKLMVGQYWNPLFFEESFPKVIQYNTGVPFIPFTRNPQVRFVFKTADNLELNLAALSQRDFTSEGPAGASTEYLKNAVIPMLNFGIRYKSDLIFIGANAQYKSIKPKSVSDQGYQIDNKVDGITTNFSLKLSPTKEFFASVIATYAQNSTDLFMQGGYYAYLTDATKGILDYKPSNTLSVAFDTQYGGDFSVGLFAGYSMNNGCSDDIPATSILYGRALNIDNILRISPRLIYKMGKLQFAGELDYTQAAYGTPNPANKFKVENTKNISNIRINLAAYLYF